MALSRSSRVTWRGAEATEAARRGGRRGLLDGAEHVLGVSRTQVPHEEGDLERSGVASVDENELLAAVSYDTPYAVRQHEELDWQHDPGRKAKYLEDPMESEGGTVQALAAAAIRRELE